MVQANDAAALRAYLVATGGWYGNGTLEPVPGRPLRPAPSRRVATGRRSDAISRRPNCSRASTCAAASGCGTRGRAELLLDYFPLIDDIDHEWFGIVDSTTPLLRRALAQRLAPFRTIAWQLADRRLQGAARLRGR